jgi:hypothetical protein
VSVGLAIELRRVANAAVRTAARSPGV